ncbi:MAG TPA: glutathione S-transferase family protein [Polyangiaceae bacterium]|jgi:glutathione S-transferase
MIKLHHNPLSSNSRKVAIVAALLGLEFESDVIDLMKPEDRKRLGALNPNGKVPVLEDGDFVLWESTAILQYLCDKTAGGERLYPRELRARAEVNRWLAWGLNHWSVAIGGITFERLWKKLVTGHDADPAQLARHEQSLHPLARVLDAHLAGRQLLAGSELTIADVAIASSLDHAAAAKLPLEPYANVRAWFERMSALPAWKNTAPSPLGRVA